MTAYRLRDAAPDDAATIFALLRALAEDMGVAENLVSGVADIARDAFGPEARYETILAESPARRADPAAGMAIVFPTYSTHKGRPCLFVDSLYVAPWARRLGVARGLMAEICRRAVARDCCRVDLNVYIDNPARKFYQRIGMGETGELPYSIGGTALRKLAGTGA